MIRCDSLVWDEGVLRYDATPEELVWADSWRSVNGKIPLPHRRRFCSGRTPTDFWEAVQQVLRREYQLRGDLFPRVWLGNSGRLHLDIRVAPPIRRQTRLWDGGHRDLRSQPLRKGPDFAVLEDLRFGARQRGYDDVVLLDQSGFVVESAAGSLVWWRGGTLVVPANPRRFPGVTVSWLIDEARQRGHQVVTEDATVGSLTGTPVWFLNALHGISPVTFIGRGDSQEVLPQHPQANLWQQWWAAGLR